MKISFINGICVKYDAISNIVHDQIEFLSESGYEVRLFTFKCDHPNIPVTIVNSVADIALDPFFQTSDIIIFHFGIYYPLFNVIFVAPSHSVKVVVFHNITPKQFLPKNTHPVIEQSFQQMSNILYSDHVVCVSKTNADDLLRAGLNTPIIVLPPAISHPIIPPTSKPSASDGIIRIVFVGRFVSSKGPTDLLNALTHVLEINKNINISLDLIGNLTFSDPEILEKMDCIILGLHTQFGPRLKINLHGNAPEEQKQSILSDADLFVLPTYHEGFCVPIVEAISNGCKVITYENSNTPEITGGLGTLVPTGDISALSDAIHDEIKKISVSTWHSSLSNGYTAYAIKASSYTSQFFPKTVHKRFSEYIQEIVK